MVTRRKAYDKAKPWLLIIEFPCHADATAAKELLQEQLSEPMGIRQKIPHPSDGNVAKWRSTAALRIALGNRTFGSEDVETAMLKAGYCGNSHDWIPRALKHGVIERLSRGTYHFLPAKLPAPSVGGEAPPSNGLNLRRSR